jgi:hypothetical protein
VDTVWDAVHTAIRPVGGAFLAVQALGATNPVFEVTVALLGGAMSFASHSLKASTRLVVNNWPEPFSNINTNMQPTSRHRPLSQWSLPDGSLPFLEECSGTETRSRDQAITGPVVWNNSGVIKSDCETPPGFSSPAAPH